MNIFVYADESGVFDKAHNKYFVYAGVIFLSKDSRDEACRKYIAAEKNIRRGGRYVAKSELKACLIGANDKRKLYRVMKDCYRFAVVVDQKRILDQIMADKKSKRRYLDFVLKIGVKRLLEELISKGIIDPLNVDWMYFYVDEHTTATNGLYDLRESLEEEFKRGMFTHGFTRFRPPIFPKMKAVDVNFCNSEAVTLIRAADIIANRVFHDVSVGNKIEPFDLEKNKMVVTYLP